MRQWRAVDEEDKLDEAGEPAKRLVEQQDKIFACTPPMEPGGKACTVMSWR